MEAIQAAVESEVPAFSTEVSYFDTDSGSFVKSIHPVVPAVKSNRDEFMVIMEQSPDKPRHGLYELKLANDSAHNLVAPVIQPDENESLVTRLKKMAVRGVNWKK